MKYFKYLYICMLLITFGCEEFKDLEVTDKPYVSQTSVVLYIGEHAPDGRGVAQLYSSPVDAGYKWVSQDPNVVTVDQKGFVKAVAEGVTSIVISSSDDQTVVDVTVKEYIPLESFTLNTYSVKGAVLSEQRVFVEPIPANASEVNITWITANEKIAQPFNNGVIRVLNAGRTTVTAKFKDTEKSIDVIVYNKLAKSKWSFPGFDPNSDNGTIGYSSQQRGDGGGVASIIDYSYDTYWHARYSSPASSYPHWFIIDLGEETNLTEVSMARRKGDARGQKGFQVFTCPQDGAADLANPTTWAWVDSGEFNFDSGRDGDQKYYIVSMPKTRYLKVYIAAKFKGGNDFAMVGDFSAWGTILE